MVAGRDPKPTPKVEDLVAEPDIVGEIKVQHLRCLGHVERLDRSVQGAIPGATSLQISLERQSRR